MDKRRWLPALCLLLAAFLPACGSLLGQKATPNVRLTQLSGSVAATATARAQGSGSSGGNLETAIADATQQSLAFSATQTAFAGSHSESLLATQTVAAPVVAELPRYGVDPAKGYAAWLHKPVSIEVTNYAEYGYANDYMQVTAKDFVLAADINWDTQYGTSGCGYMFRSNADKNKPDQYIVLMSRIATGYIAFTAVKEGQPANIHVFYPKDNDKTFQWENATTNRLAVVARGDLIEIYTNGVKVGEVDITQPPPTLRLPPPPAMPFDTADLAAMSAYDDQKAEHEKIVQRLKNTYDQAVSNYFKAKAVFHEGFLAMIAASESGKTVCNFDNAWLWMITSE